MMERDWVQVKSIDNFLKYVQLLNPQETALVSWISRKELLCLCEQPECVFVPGESWGGSGYSLTLSWSQKWTNSLSSSLKAAPALTQDYLRILCHSITFTKLNAPRSTVDSLNSPFSCDKLDVIVYRVLLACYLSDIDGVNLREGSPCQLSSGDISPAAIQ